MASQIFLSFLLLSVLAITTALALDPEMISVMGYKPNIRVKPFSSMTQTTYHIVSGATVNIETNYVKGRDKIFVDYQGMFPIRGVFDEDVGVLYLEGEAPITEYAAALTSVVFTTTAEDGMERKITATFGKNTFYVSSTRHFYEIVDRVHPPWNEGSTACGNKQYMETFKGYLATIGSHDELAGVGSKLTKAYWVGAKRRSADDTWAWAGGPDDGEVFWKGKSIYLGGAPFPDEYSFASWKRFQPNDGGDNLMMNISNAIGEAHFDDGSDLSDVQGYICEYGGLEDANTASQYQWYTDTTILRFDCNLFSTSTECTNRKELGCSWSGARCSNTACSGIVTQRECVSNWQCGWNTDGLQGVCVSTTCSKFSGSACAFPLCNAVSVGGASQCRDAKCYDLVQNSDVCSKKSGCNWRGTFDANSPGRCYYDRSIDCSGSDIVYMMDGTAKMSEEYNKYTSGFFALSQMLKDADFALTGRSAAEPVDTRFGARVGFVQYGGTRAIATDSANLYTNGRLTGLVSEAINDLTWHQSAYTASVTPRTAEPGLEKAYSMMVAAGGNTRSKVIVMVATGGFDDAQRLATNKNTAGSILKKIADAGMIIVGVSLRPSYPATPDSAAAVRDLTAIGARVIDITLGEFADRVIYGLCSSKAGTAGALVSATPKGVDCEDYTTYDACNPNALCQWDYSASKCGQSQCLALTQTVCPSNTACSYDSVKGRCGRICSSYTSSATCTGGCVWRTPTDATLSPFCDSAPCVSNINEDSCVAEAGCYFDTRGVIGACRAKICQATDAATCVADPQCVYKNGYCFLNTCTDTSMGTCNNKEQCAWDPKTSKCRPNECAYYQGEAACAGDTACQWSTKGSPAMCVRAPCSYLAKNATDNYENACRSYPQCYWQTAAENGLANICIPRICESNKRSCDCMKMDGCVWRDNQCKTSVFTQCTAADTIFLVEATKKMDRSFSRHPSGIQGTISSIRTWAKAAPIAPDSGALGFRLGLIGYGSAGAALYPTRSPCSNSNTAGLCTSVSQFVGPTSAISSFLDSTSTYVNGVSNDITAIKKGLEAALDLFRANAVTATPRKKMLVVIGNSALTDGNALLDQTINDLEAIGVTIFSILVQRFDSISAEETLAAQLIAPIASDPQSSHFSFTTIENFYSSVLDNFCDPTTSTGDALGVSRNGILPCDWLSGATECNIETSCSFNPTGSRTCALPSQCPNLGCVALPDALAAQGFECRNCKLVSGSFQCSAGFNEQAPKGLCQKDPCTVANCDTSSCTAAAPSCFWSTNSNICLRSMCVATTRDSCNTDLGCVWTDKFYADKSAGQNVYPRRAAGCTFSGCGKSRDAVTCNTAVVLNTQDLMCQYNEALSPAICVERRCIYLNKTSCDDNVFCDWSTLDSVCKETLCQYSTNEACEMDPGCYWDAFKIPTNAPTQRGSCLATSGDCKLSPAYRTQADGGWSDWSAHCGANAIRTRSRTILSFPVGAGQTCAAAAAADGEKLFEVQSAASAPAGTPNLPEASCTTFCAKNTNPDDCADNYECQWTNGVCSPVNMKSCLLLDETACVASDMCVWDSDNSYCKNGITLCQQTNSRDCTSQTSCVWRTGANDMMWGKSTDAPVQLINPNEDEIFPFVTLSGTDDRIISGASVTIEENYQRGKDTLDVAYPIYPQITYSWNPVTATLTFSGNAPITEYLSAIRFVTFVTSSQRAATRTITYALGSGMLYCALTGHLYQHVKATATWDQAKANCSATSTFGYHGYLATISSDEENSLIASKMNAEGWLSGDDYVTGVWRFSTGPDSGRIFWTGDSPINGGYAAPGQYANWDTMANQPVRASTSYSHPYLNKTGYWTTQSEGYSSPMGYICEFIGMPNDVPNNTTKLGDSAIIGIGGCLPTESCGIHTTTDACTADFECLWRGNKCVSGCSILATASECSAAAGSTCLWDTAVVPPVCDLNPCTSLSQASCTSTKQCSWGNNGCVKKSGCAQFTDSGACDQYESCIWTPTSVGGQCDTRSCKSITSEYACLKNPTCEWSTTLGCTTSLCKYGTHDVCAADTRCTWNQPDSSVAGFLAGGEKVAVFTSGSQRPSDFTSSADGIVVAIVEGFQSGSDILALDPVDRSGTYVGTYNPAAGVLSIRVAPGAASTPYDAFGFLQNNVKFYTSSGSSATRLISFTIGQKTVFSPTRRVYYRVANSTGLPTTTRAQAAQVCANSLWMGQPGRLASITTEADNTLLSTVGAYGWVSASNIGANTWKWENVATNFWTGASSLGKPANDAFAMWAIGQPTDGASSAFMTESGTWKAVDSVGVSIPVLCEYGGPSVDLQLYGTRAVKPVGCFATPCLDLSRLQCVITTGCSWNIDSCREDTFCTNAVNSSVCNSRELCYWDASAGTCSTAPDTVCSRLRNPAVCIDYAQCDWRDGIIQRDPPGRGGACYLKGCAAHPVKVACTGDALCRWDAASGNGGQCTNRLCGYTDISKCWTDSLCEWNYKTGFCQQSDCYGRASCDGQCTQKNGVCAKVQCAATDMATCHSDPDCLWMKEACTKPDCEDKKTEKSCTDDPQCYFTYKPIRCAAAQCIANLDQPTCEKVVGGMAQCRWTGLACRELTWLERNAPSASATCEREVEPNLWWLWLLLAIIIIIIALIIWRLYLAYAKGLNFFEPNRRNVKYSPHEQYAADLFEDAQQHGEETNVDDQHSVNHKRPSLNDL